MTNQTEYQIWCHIWDDENFYPICIEYGRDFKALYQKCDRLNRSEVRHKIENPNIVFASYGLAQSIDIKQLEIIEMKNALWRNLYE